MLSAFLTSLGTSLRWIYTTVKTYLERILHMPVLIIAYVWSALAYIVHWISSHVWSWITSAFQSFFSSLSISTGSLGDALDDFPLVGYVAHLFALDVLADWFGIWLSAIGASLVIYFAAVCCKWVTRVIP